MSEFIPQDDRTELYRKSGDLVAAIATEHFDLDVPELSLERVREFMGLMREVDTRLDDTDATPEEVLASLESFEEFRAPFPHLTPESLGPEVHAGVINRTRRVFHYGARAANATTPTRYRAFRILEASESTSIIGDIVEPYVAEQPRFDEFMDTMRALGEAATLWDSLIDARQDFREGKQALKPSREYYVKILGAMVHRGMIGDRALMHPGPLRHLATKGGMRVINRIQNGIPEYSNLYRFKRHKREL